MTNTTWDPNAESGMALSNGNLTATITTPPGADGMSVRGTTSRTTGKAYVEFTMGQVSSGGLTHIGIANSSWDYTNPETLGLDANSFEYESDGAIFVAGRNMASADTFGAGDIVQLCVDFDAQLFWVTKNNDGNWNGTNANPAAGTGGISFYTVAGACFYAGYCSANGGDSATVNFGASAFSYTAPSGFSAWETETTKTIWDPNAEDGMTLSNNNLTASVTTSGTGGMSVRSLTFCNAGKVYVEFTVGQVSSNGSTRIGVANDWWNYTQGETLGLDANSFGYESDGYIFIASDNMASADSFAAGDIVQLSVDFGAQLFWVTKNGDGNWNGVSASPAAGTGGVSFSSIPGPWFVAYCSATAGDSVTVNFGASAFSCSVPSGFSAWGGGFGGGITPKPAALLGYPGWKRYANWQFGNNGGNNIAKLDERYGQKWVHSHDSNNTTYQVEQLLPPEPNNNFVAAKNYVDIVAIWTGGKIKTAYANGGTPDGHVTSLQVELPLDTAFPPLTSVAYVEGRFRCPSAKGSWPAWWTLGHYMGCGTTADGGCSGDKIAWGPEIDILELELPVGTTYGKSISSTSIIDATLHARHDSNNSCFENNSPPANIPPGYTDYTGKQGTVKYKTWLAGQENLGYLHTDQVVYTAQGFHTYGCLIEPNHTISIWIDNQKIGHFDATRYYTDQHPAPDTAVALQLLISLQLNNSTPQGPGNFGAKNYTGSGNKYRLGIKDIQIWGPKGG